MSSAKSFAYALGIGVVGACTVIGCSASSDSPIGWDDSEDAASPPTVLPEAGTTKEKVDSGTYPEADAAPDASDETTDSGADGDADPYTDAGDETNRNVDAAPPDPVDLPASGTACTTKDEIQQQTCGLCGTQTRLCAPSDTDPDGLVWQPWGYCQHEVEDGCVPGTTTTESCGLCGTRPKVCQIDCRYAVGACKGEPANACSPGTIDFQAGLSCDAGGRSRVCSDSCMFGSFGECFVPGEPTLVLAETEGGKVSNEFTLPASITAPRLSGSCPSGSLSSTDVSYQYVTLVNPTSSTVVVSVWTGQSSHAGAAYMDTVIAAYNAASAPVTDAERKACAAGVNDTCSDSSDPTACDSSWGGLFDTSRVTIGPNAKAYVYVAAYYGSTAGDYVLTARTDTIQ